MTAPNAKPATKPIERELVHICGDVPDPTAQNSGIRGSETHYDLAAGGRIGQVPVRYRSKSGAELLLTIDVYHHPGEPLEVLLLCPQCSTPAQQHQLRITSQMKHIDYDREKNVLSVEKFGCTWELDTAKPVGLIGNANLCGWSAVIDRNVARDV